MEKRLTDFFKRDIAEKTWRYNLKKSSGTTDKFNSEKCSMLFL